MMYKPRLAKTPRRNQRHIAIILKCGNELRRFLLAITEVFRTGISTNNERILRFHCQYYITAFPFQQFRNGKAESQRPRPLPRINRRNVYFNPFSR